MIDKLLNINEVIILEIITIVNLLEIIIDQKIIEIIITTSEIIILDQVELTHPHQEVLHHL